MLPASHERHAAYGALLIGIGLGGFADGIVLHQIMQWHHMLSSVIPPDDMEAMSVNMRWDGIFHVVVWIVTLAGAAALWSSGRRNERTPSLRRFSGLVLVGWGLFNLVEGVINHHLLGIHHVRYHGDVLGGEPSLAWGLGFVLVGGVGFLLVGWLLAREKM
jgi:uncharacterized membrane protein